MKDEIVDIVDFIKSYIGWRPLHWDSIHQPDERFDLTIVCFPRFNGKDVTIEYGLDGRIYVECIDFSHYHDGDVIAMDAPERDIWINYTQLTESNKEQIGYKINAMLNKFYDFRQFNKTDIIYECLYMKDQIKELKQQVEDLREELDSRPDRLIK